MSSPNFLESSPVSLSSQRRRKSAFTYRQLAQLAASATSCPLRVIAHIDLDAFYAQCEMVRLDIPPDKPLAVQQWQGLIAINYPARAFGLNRHVTITEAVKQCPDLIMQHVATWKEGDEKWAYHEDSFKNMATHKVSLDPYRLESRRILACIKDHLPAAPISKVEKASIDEVFLDLSTHVHGIMLERFPELKGPPPYDDPTEQLPRPPTTALEWDTDALVDLDSTETEDDDPDWDDVAMVIASEIVRGVRAKIYEVLKYTCSAGVARNKMLAKLGSAHKKPNQQTIIRNRAVHHFLSDFKFTKIRNLGGKLGDEIVAAFSTDTVKDLLEVPVEQLKKKIGDDTGTWLYSIIRGEDHSEVNPRTQIKSMLSAKSFRPSINALDSAVRWIRIFVADIFSRLVEEGVLENKRRPKTLSLYHRQGAQTRSKSASIPMGRTMDETLLFDIAKGLLAQVIAEGRAWPCANLSLSVSGFEEGVTGNKGIGGFLLRGDEAKAISAALREPSETRNPETPPPNKRRRVEESGIQRFFGARHESSGGISEREEQDNGMGDETGEAQSPFDVPPSAQGASADMFKSHEEEQAEHPDHDASRYTCPRCNSSLLVTEQGEHDDWHFAKDLAADLAAEERANAAGQEPSRPPSTSTKPSTQPKSKGRGRPPNVVKAEKGQKKLQFG